MQRRVHFTSLAQRLSLQRTPVPGAIISSFSRSKTRTSYLHFNNETITNRTVEGLRRRGDTPIFVAAITAQRRRRAQNFTTASKPPCIAASDLERARVPLAPRLNRERASHPPHRLNVSANALDCAVSPLDRARKPLVATASSPKRTRSQPRSATSAHNAAHFFACLESQMVAHPDRASGSSAHLTKGFLVDGEPCTSPRRCTPAGEMHAMRFGRRPVPPHATSDGCDLSRVRCAWERIRVTEQALFLVAPSPFCLPSFVPPPTRSLTRAEISVVSTPQDAHPKNSESGCRLDEAAIAESRAR
ncbi:hypothetical protein B0H19DRAFT_1253431 [Mycena capillaripes]|nr:hypothetical protein B0H19DRAFT_1253431 [Mycena capillaripes]